MSKLVAILCIFTISSQALYQGLIYGYYVLNKTYIKDNFCENKAKPELACDGKCHLKKMLSVSEKTTEAPEQLPSLPSLDELKLPTLFYQSQQFLVLQSYWCITTLNSPLAALETPWCYSFDPVYSCFKPPQA